MQKPHIVFAGKNYSIENLNKESRNAPVVTVPLSEMADNYQTLVEVKGEDNNGVVILYKYEGRYVILLGAEIAKHKIEKHNKIEGRLLSKQMLKHVSVVDVPVSVQNSQANAVERALEEQFTPRYTDRNADGMNRVGERFKGNFRRDEGQAYGNPRPFSPDRSTSEFKGHRNATGFKSRQQG